jgi:hypothetical protein
MFPDMTTLEILRFLVNVSSGVPEMYVELGRRIERGDIEDTAPASTDDGKADP